MTASRSSGGIAAACAVCLSIAACDGDTRDPDVVASNDTLTIAAGGSANLLANDSYEGSAATAANVSFATSASLPAGVTVDGGIVRVGTTAAPGTVTLPYTICDVANAANCARATAQITIPAPALLAVDDAFTLRGGQSAEVLVNDTLGGATIAAGQVTVTATSSLPAGITLTASGVVAADASAASGAYAVGYRVCQAAAPSNCATATATVTVPAGGRVSGRAVSAATGSGVAGVTVSIAGVRVTTDSAGNFDLPGVAAGDRVPVVFAADGYVTTTRIATVGTGTAGNLQARLVPVGSTAVIDAAAGGTVAVAGTAARISLPANAVQRADGSAPSGAVTVRATALDPSSDSAVMPGDFTTLVAGAAAPIESFGALDITLVDATGAPLVLRSGQVATLRIAVGSRSGAPPASIPLFWFDTASGRWVQDGTAVLGGSGSAAFYEGTVTRLATWNADQVYNTVRVSGCVADANGAPVAGATVSSDGVSYSGTSSAVTDPGGRFVLSIRTASQATISGAGSNLYSNTVAIGPYGADTTLTPCLSLSQAGSGITMKLTWGQRPSDLDSHLFAPNGSHVFYGGRGSLTAAPYANLDVDDTSSYGPEVVTIARLMVGTYKYAVYNYSGYGAGPITAANARVELNIPGRATQLFAPPAGETSATASWNLFEIDVDAQCTVTVRRVDTFTSGLPAAAPSTPPAYCTAP